MRYLALVSLAACTAPPPQPSVRTDGVLLQLASLEHRLLAQTIATDTDDCNRAVRQAKAAGGIVYVDQHGHCTFVRPLPGRHP